MSYIPPLPADMVDEYLTFNCKTLRKLERKLNAASADGYKIMGTIRSYEDPEYDYQRFWAVMTKRVDPKLLAVAVSGKTEESTFIPHQIDEPSPIPSGGSHALERLHKASLPKPPKRNTRPPFR